MRMLLSFWILLLFVSCSKEADRASGRKLVSITVNGKTDERFSYNNDGQLQKFERFGHCIATPMDEEEYHYEGGKLSKIASVTRSIYSSMSATCDPASGIKNEHSFIYNSQGKVQRITTANTYRDFYYNRAGQVEKQVIDGNSQYSSFYEYDSRGNLVKYTDHAGIITQYEYDNKTNPFYLSKLSPGTIIAFYVSPNNVVTGIANGAVYFTRQFTYNSEGFPATVVESTNNLVYTFHYK